MPPPPVTSKRTKRALMVAAGSAVLIFVLVAIRVGFFLWRIDFGPFHNDSPSSEVAAAANVQLSDLGDEWRMIRSGFLPKWDVQDKGCNPDSPLWKASEAASVHEFTFRLDVNKREEGHLIALMTLVRTPEEAVGQLRLLESEQSVNCTAKNAEDNVANFVDPARILNTSVSPYEYPAPIAHHAYQMATSYIERPGLAIARVHYAETLRMQVGRLRVRLTFSGCCQSIPPETVRHVVDVVAARMFMAAGR